MAVRKLIEVALPLESINREAEREKSPRLGHPSTLHLWWARRPLAACRAVLFAQLVDDPSSYPDLFPTEEEQAAERQRLFRIIEDLVKWENSNNEEVLAAARLEIARSVSREVGVPLPDPVTPEAILKFLAEQAPPVLDPFCGGGSIPLEAQRLGLRSVACDLNPVAVVITKALIEIPRRFPDLPPVHPPAGQEKLPTQWRGALGLADDVRYYANWLRDEAKRRIGHLYPSVMVRTEYSDECPEVRPYVNKELPVLAWLWARTVRCPNPACGGVAPLVGSMWLCRKARKRVWLEPIPDYEAKRVHFRVRSGEGEPPSPPKVGGRSSAFRCLLCGQVIQASYLEEEGAAGRFGTQLLAIVADTPTGRLYLPADPHHEAIANGVTSEQLSNTFDYPLPPYSQALPTSRYGATKFSDLFTPRQRATLSEFSSLIAQAHERVRTDAKAAGLPDDDRSFAEGGAGARAYADAVTAYLALTVGRLANRSSAFCFWDAGSEKVQQPFAVQGINKAWDFAEGNPFSEASGSYLVQVEYLTRVLELGIPVTAPPGTVRQASATRDSGVREAVVCCDPPYYSNIGYADLSDFFYVWLRLGLKDVFPDLFGTVLTPKDEELVAAPHRFGGDRLLARNFFLEGLRQAFSQLKQSMREHYPAVVFYSFKQQEANGDGSQASTGWEVMLESLLSVGLGITGTWPVRTENVEALKKDKGALSSSIVLVCRPRPSDAPVTSRRDFFTALKRELPAALRKLQQGNIAPVDLAQAALGPGMAIFSRYSKVLEADGSPMRVRTALSLINQVLDEFLAEQEGEYDAATRWAVAWFEQFGVEEGPFGDAEILSKAKNTAIAALEQDGILVSKGGKVRLLRRDELRQDWDPTTDRRLTVWEVTQHLIRLHQTEGDMAAAILLRKVGGLGEEARALAYRLYTIAERKGWTQEALAYNSLVVAWPEIVRLSAQQPQAPNQPNFPV